MKKIIFLIILAAFSQVVFCSDINEMKEEALQQMIRNVESLQRTINETLAAIPNASEFIYNITRHENLTAEAFVNNTFADVRATTISARLAADLLNSSADVLECVRDINAEIHEKIENFYANNFLAQFNEYYLQGLEIQRNDIARWNEDFHAAITNFNQTYDSFYRDIVKSNSAGEIAWLSEEFDKICWQLNNFITEITATLPKHQFELLVIMESLIDNLRRFTREKGDTLFEFMKGCFNNEFVKNSRFYNSLQ